MLDTTRARVRIPAIALAALVGAILPAAASAAAPMSFGTVSVGATKTLGTTVPLAAAVSDLDPATVLLAYHPFTLPVFTYVQFSDTGIPTTQTPTANTLGNAGLR